MKILVTGAGGFIGRHVINELLDQTSWKIVALDRHGERLPRESTRLRTIGHDFDRAPDLSPWIEGVDAVINLASSSDVLAFLQNPVKHTMNNVVSTLNLLEWARYRELSAFIQLSTNEVYGPRPDDFSLSVEGDELRPQTPYSASKAAQEMLALGWRQTYGVPVVIVNTMHVFGEEQPSQRFVPTVIDKILKGESVPIFQDPPRGAQVRNWTYVGDLAHSLVMILQSCFADDMIPTTYRWNVAGLEMSCLSVARMIGQLMHYDFNVEWLVDSRPGYAHRYALSTEKFRQTFDYQPRYGLVEGLRRTIEAFKREKNEA